MCGVPALDDFFTTHAGQNQRRNVSRTWVLQRDDGDSTAPSVLGFYTLTLGAVERETLPHRLGKKLPRYPVPVVVIGRLAVDKRARGNRCGERLLVDAQARAIKIAGQAGSVGIVVDAKDSAAVGLYAHYGFEVLEHSEQRTWPKRMFLPMDTVRAAHGS